MEKYICKELEHLTMSQKTTTIVEFEPHFVEQMEI